MPNFTLRFYPDRNSDFQAGPARRFSSHKDLDDFMVGLSFEVREIAWVTLPNGNEQKYAGPPSSPSPFE
jgi:hypothetical protein